MLLFIFKHYLLLAKCLLLISFLFFLSLFFGQNLFLASFDIFVNKNNIKNLINSFALYLTFYIINLLIIINYFIWAI